MDGELHSPAYRRRLSNRRHAITEPIIVDNTMVTATIGFDETGAPKEVFLDGGKTGSNLDFMLDDASVMITIALQHGVSAQALAKSIARVPGSIDGPATKAASVSGAAL